MTLDTTNPILVIGAGIMGAGIVQVAAQAGHPVMLFDTRNGAADEAIKKLSMTFDLLVGKGKLTPDAATSAIGRIQSVDTLDAARDARLVIEAIVENLDIKRGLLKQLEAIVAVDCVLASNTSSISITALSNGMVHPERLVGMHFFNPVPLMKLVEVVSGLRTSAAVAEQVFDLGRRWGKVSVHARSTPGFIVNRIARPFYAEALALLLERAASAADLDDCLRGAGFRMGACELMDLIGHDTNFAVTQSVYDANFSDKRFAPSLVQRELVDGGLLGRKSGHGFFDYASETKASGERSAGEPVAPVALPAGDVVVVHGRGMASERWSDVLSTSGRRFERRIDSGWCGLEVDGAQLRQTDGRPAALVAHTTGSSEVALFDRPFTALPTDGAALAWTASKRSSPRWQELAPQWIAALGLKPVRLDDAAGLVTTRTIAMLINEACDAVLQGVCTPEAADAAMKLGVNYPSGPFEWLMAWDATEVVAVLDHLDAHYRGERYRVSPELRQRAWARKDAT